MASEDAKRGLGLAGSNHGLPVHMPCSNKPLSTVLPGQGSLPSPPSETQRPRSLPLSLASGELDFLLWLLMRLLLLLLGGLCSAVLTAARQEPSLRQLLL